MTLANIGATTRRVFAQLSHDPRTLLLIFIVPCVLEILLRAVYHDNARVFNLMAVPLLWLFPFVIMFVVTSIATLRERTNGTMERILTMPTNKYEFIVGYALAFAALSIAQTLVVSALVLGPLGLEMQAGVGLVVLTAMLNGLLGTALGLCVSAFANSEFQAVQLMPMIVLPQVLICGLLVPRETMLPVLEWVSVVLPLTYATDAMNQLALSAAITTRYWQASLITVGFIIAALLVGASTINHKASK